MKRLKREEKWFWIKLRIRFYLEIIYVGGREGLDGEVGGQFEEEGFQKLRSFKREEVSNFNKCG